VEENTNINVVVETKENYPQLSKYAKAKLNVLDEVPQSFTSKESKVGTNKVHNQNT
jgi:hypothetical protein